MVAISFLGWRIDCLTKKTGETGVVTNEIFPALGHCFLA